MLSVYMHTHSASFFLWYGGLSVLSFLFCELCEEYCKYYSHILKVCDDGVLLK
jgi:hypothetical protein